MTEIEKYYNKFNEDHRLTTRHGTVEFLTSLHFIQHYIDILRGEIQSDSSIDGQRDCQTLQVGQSVDVTSGANKALSPGA